MSRVKDFLTKLDDYELANFAKFKRLSYMKETQLEIENYLAARHLTESRINQLISENKKRTFNDNNIRCSRCYSNKIRVEKTEFTNTTDEFDVAVLDGIAGKSTYKDKIICNVCGLWLTDPNNEKEITTWNSIWNFITDLLSRI
ncbi:hypothetical protein [uncultured Psychroserpens sp.]|uniref:hypothetical protein n=1 Tax=uncultured Psychroserpens sp. TaxID=255436 RepID=UPI00261D4A9F|nr:hypothetical protein [uncultured Psychroserpens sp.]